MFGFNGGAGGEHGVACARGGCLDGEAEMEVVGGVLGERFADVCAVFVGGDYGDGFADAGSGGGVEDVGGDGAAG